MKPVTERTAGTDLLEPTPNFDCHISRSIQNLPANTPLSQLFDYSQVLLSSLSFLPVFVTGCNPGSHMPLLYLRHSREYCLHYCWDIWENALPFNKKHCMSLPLECLWSWNQVSFASMSAVKTGMTSVNGNFCFHLGTVSKGVPEATSQGARWHMRTRPKS